MVLQDWSYFERASPPPLRACAMLEERMLSIRQEKLHLRGLGPETRSGRRGALEGQNVAADLLIRYGATATSPFKFFTPARSPGITVGLLLCIMRPRCLD